MKRYLLLILGILIFAGWGCNNQPVSTKQQASSSSGDCAKADYPFACYLDSAMQARDPNKCILTGDKRIVCLKAYEEITTEKVDCSKLSDVQFQTECKQQLHIKMPDTNISTTGTVDIPQQETSTGTQ